MRTTRRPSARRGRRPLLALLLAGPVVFGSASGLVGQQAGPATPEAPTGALGLDPDPDPPVPAGLTPRGAFIRSLFVPGWGHVASRSYARAGFYVTALSGSLWMLQQTIVRHGEAETFLEVERELATSRLMAAGTSDPDELRSALDDDDRVVARDALVAARGEQAQDWTALSLFLVLLGATDALVAAHLADYPEPLTFRAVPLGGGQVELSVSIPLEQLRFSRSPGRR